MRLEVKICEKGDECLHFKIKDLIEELGGLGGDNIKMLKGEKQLKDFKKKIRKLHRLVKKLEKVLTEDFNTHGRYCCIDPKQIIWGRRMYQQSLQKLWLQRREIQKTAKKEILAKQGGEL